MKLNTQQKVKIIKLDYTKPVSFELLFDLIDDLLIESYEEGYKDGSGREFEPDLEKDYYN